MASNKYTFKIILFLEGRHEDLKEWKGSKEITKDKNAWKQFTENLSETCMRTNSHKSKYDDDGGVVTLDSNIKLHVRISHYILSIIISLLHYCCELVS